jgi:hypothetical protein
MGPLPSYAGGARPRSNRARRGWRVPRHGAEGAVVCLLIFLASCGGPHQIVISECSAGNAAIVFPTDDQSQVDPYGTFRWPFSADVTSYLLIVGTQAGSTNIWSDTINHATSTRIPVLQPFTTYHLQLAAQAASACSVSKTSFTTGAGLAHLKTPADGAADVDPAVTFTWNGVVDAEMFQLELSIETPGGDDQYESGELPNITSWPTRICCRTPKTADRLKR